MNNLLFLHLSAVFECNSDKDAIEKQPIKEYTEPVKTKDRRYQYEFYFSKRSK